MHKWQEINDFVCKNNQCDFIGDQLPTKTPMELKDNSIDLSVSDY